MAITCDTATCRNLDQSLSLEWLATNGLGGYASGSVAGANTRKYHGYLVVAAHPPVQRFVVLSRVEDRVLVDGVPHDLSTDEFPDIIHPQGYLSLISFEQAAGLCWRFQIGDAVIEKSLTLVHGEDTVIVRYELIGGYGRAPIHLQVQPMLAGRDFHATTNVHYRPSWQCTTAADQPRALQLAAPQCPVKVTLSHNADEFRPNPCWWYNFIFRQERLRGYPDRDDLWTPGTLEFILEEGKPVGFICSTQAIPFDRHAELIARERERHEGLTRSLASLHTPDPLLEQLTVAADQFLVQRGVAGSSGARQMSIIAGYPWFEDWGRDTFISLPGLTMVTGRYDAARTILATFADHMQRGLLPNRFPDKAFHPDYNTVDASMWFVHAAYQYWRYSGDDRLLTEYLYKPLCDIMDYYRDGTDFGIKMDKDGLIRAGAHGTQLTWMDAKVGDWVVTPRHGKPVEINALWYNNLRIMEQIANKADDTTRAEQCAAQADQTAASFAEQFWNRHTQCLSDVIADDGTADGAIRPNQLLAVSLPFSPLPDALQKQIVATCHKQLLTPMGMRTLAPKSLGYHGRCAGDQRARDMAYHQGTVWPWLIGPFVSAFVKVNGQTAGTRNKARQFLAPFADHLNDYGLGSICEIADGDPPHAPRGCIAQAWSVGEVLRAYYEDVLARAPLWPHQKTRETVRA